MPRASRRWSVSPSTALIAPRLVSRLPAAGRGRSRVQVLIGSPSGSKSGSRISSRRQLFVCGAFRARITLIYAGQSGVGILFGSSRLQRRLAARCTAPPGSGAGCGRSLRGHPRPPFHSGIVTVWRLASQRETDVKRTSLAGGFHDELLARLRARGAPRRRPACRKVPPGARNPHRRARAPAFEIRSARFGRTRRHGSV